MAFQLNFCSSLERAGELTSNQELSARVWPNIFVGSVNMSVHITKSRGSLRDGRDGNRFIIDVPGRGYSFVASLREQPWGTCYLKPARSAAIGMDLRQG